MKKNWGKVERAKWAREWRAKNRERVRTKARAVQGTGQEAKDDNIIFYGYKEPLRKFEGGYGYLGVLSYDKSKGKVQCHLCGLLFRMINNGHLGRIHGITAREYKEKTGLSQMTALMGEETREKIITTRGHNPNCAEVLKEAQKKRRERLANGDKDLQSGFKMSLEVRNKRGTCPDQLLDKISKTIKSYGRVVTADEFKKFHHGRFLGSVYRTYGTWEHALSLLGYRSFRGKHYKEEELLEAMRNFYLVNKRTPRYSDFNRGLLPSYWTYKNKFGTFNEARKRAGVPILVSNGRHYTETFDLK